VSASMNQPNPGPGPALRFIQAAGGPPNSIREMLSVPSAQRDVDWLRTSLQMAVELELSTIPPYQCGLWSIVTQSGPVYDHIRTIVLEEMGHMGLACNMLTTIGGTPQINTPGAVPKYPGHRVGSVPSSPSAWWD
jgi:ferritin-like protein